MKRSFLQILLFTLLSIYSCEPRINSGMISKVEGDNFSCVINISEDNIIKEINSHSIRGDFGKYANYFSNPDATIGISSSRYYPLGEETIMAFFDPIKRINTKGYLDSYAKEIQINGRNVFTQSTKGTDGFISDLFGKNVSISVSGCTKGDNSATDIELYAPNIVRIEFPTIESEENRYPLCYYKQFIVRWNEDPSNENGVVIIIKWDGTMVFGNDYSSSYIYHTICVPDTGCVELDETMFEGIPDTAFCNMLLLRGDIANTEIDENVFRLLVESHDVIDFILVRNIE